MKPTPSDVHVNRPLTMVSTAYIQSAVNYVADQVFPRVPVPNQSDVYFQYSKADFMRDEMKLRAPATESAGGGFDVSTASYNALVWALHKDIADQVRGNADAPLNMDRDTTEYLTQQGLIRKDRLWASNYFTTGIWTGDQTGVAAAPGANQFLQFNDANSIPATIIHQQATAILLRTGFLPNKLVLGRDVYTALQDNPQIMDRIKYTQRGNITPDLLASVFGVDQVLVANAIYNTALEGAAASMAAAVNSKAALLVYANPTPSLMQPSGGYTFSWTGMPGMGVDSRIKKFRLEQIAADRVEIEMAFAQKLVSSDVGVFLTAAVA